MNQALYAHMNNKRKMKKKKKDSGPCQYDLSTLQNSTEQAKKVKLLTNLQFHS
jgi:hypothetical protein